MLKTDSRYIRSGELNAKNRELLALQAQARARLAKTRTNFAEGMKAARDVQRDLEWTQKKVRYAFHFQHINRGRQQKAHRLTDLSTRAQHKSTPTNIAPPVDDTPNLSSTESHFPLITTAFRGVDPNLGNRSPCCRIVYANGRGDVSSSFELLVAHAYMTCIGACGEGYRQIPLQ